MIKRLLILIVLVLAFGIFAFAEEKNIEAIASEADIQLEQNDDSPVVEIGAGWVWGDVINVYREDKMLRLQYLDFATEETGNIRIVIDGQTVFENVEGLGQIDKGDSLSVDYVVSENNENIARLIAKEDRSQSE